MPALLLAGLLAVTCSLASAEQERKLPVVAQLYYSTPALAKPADDAFRVGLRELGYVDGRDVTVVTFYAEGNEEQIRVLVNKLVSAKVDVMVVSAKAVHAALEATKTIPIVSTLGDPVRAGLVKSLSHPGGNFTGISVRSWETDVKKFEILREMLPTLNRAVLLYDANYPEDVAGSKELQAFARRQGVTVRLAGVRTRDEMRFALSDIEKLSEKALIVYDNPFTWLHRQTIIDLAAHRVPIVSERRDWAEAGALFTYATALNGLEESRRWATYVVKILKGAKPGDLPIEQVDKFDFVVNLKTAREFQITIPNSILARADEVIR
jgi:putative ABC transport system substrate-binding protein